MNAQPTAGEAQRQNSRVDEIFSSRRVLLAMAISLLFLLSSSALALLCGATNYSLTDIITDQQAFDLVASFRLPRTCFAILVGAGLSIVGACYQALFRNYLASPFTLGVSSGAALAASIALMLGGATSRYTFDVSVCAILGALLSIGFILAIHARQRRPDASSLLLIGIVYSFFCSSVLTLMQYVSDYSQLFRVTRWLMGGIPSVEWRDIGVGFVCVSVMVVWLMRNSRGLDLMLFGDELASVKGIDVRELTRTSFVLTSFVVGWIVAQCGVIGFVGIIVPAICRFMVGLRHRTLIPLAGIIGAGLVVLCDALGRCVIAPFEVPAGAFTAVLGGPVFIVLAMHPGRMQRPIT